MSDYHISVLLQDTINYLEIKPREQYIDGTIGGGGHTLEILKKGGRVLGIDVDQDALQYIKNDNAFKDYLLNGNLVLANGNFKDINKIANENRFKTVSGILLDLGISSHHVDQAHRGFSFQKDGPLDMRMDTRLVVTAADLVNGLTKNELFELFTRYGEERYARVIVTQIIKYRKNEKIKSTKELAEIIKNVVPFKNDGIHPATKVFQALRILVNDELNVLKETLPEDIKLLESKGRLAIISFHSLEDRIVKQSFLEFESTGLGKVITKKPIVPSTKEITINSRSRSSKLRVFEKI